MGLNGTALRRAGCAARLQAVVLLLREPPRHLPAAGIDGGNVKGISGLSSFGHLR